jgi:high-affinity Fe2+/Pb2+ permease
MSQLTEYDEGLEKAPRDVVIRINDHPRACRQIELARGWGGIGSFALVALLGYEAGIAPVSVGLRALIAGVLGYFVFWGLAVMVWRHLAVAEEAAARVSAEQRRKALLEEIERRNASLSDKEALR